ncbi:unnamed protein product [Hermetia illucens]|uniref:Uncharacterized protein n=1 Tax=Hermetia illucens TaxID=343691 RepID=A0A7R8Z2U1_HERIL|nr:neprilysin-4-like [Hermetia illucens]CAD7091262.1 unnamed protein product [Hermetia illucens]
MWKCLVFILVQICAASLVGNLWQIFQRIPRTRQVDPCSDFYQFACEAGANDLDVDSYSENTTLGFLEIAKQRVAESLSKSLSRNSLTRHHHEESLKNTRKFYLVCLNTQSGSALLELKKLLQSFVNLPIVNENWDEKRFKWAEETSALRKYGVQAIIHEFVAPDWKNASAPKIYFVAPKFDFVHKEDLLGTSRNSGELVSFYKRYIELIFKKLGLSIQKAGEVSEEIVAFETEIAKIVPDESDVTPPQSISFNALSERIPQIDWLIYFANILGRPIRLRSPLIVINEEYYRKLVNLISRTQRRVIAQYLLFKFMFKFRAAVEDAHSPEYCLEDVIKKMKTTVGKVFVNNYYSPETKQSVSEIVADVKEAFAEMLNESVWLDQSTKSQALEKLRAVRTIIGYSDDLFTDNREASIRLTNNYYENCMELARHEAEIEHRQLEKGLHPWIPSSVDPNAFYNVTANTIFIPAGLLVPPVYDKTYPKYRNYGVLGAIIGHVLTHGFDFEGKDYDSKGSLQTWWTTKSLIAYYSHLECVLPQYNNISASESRESVGDFGGLSENVADSGGIQVAFRAYMNWKRRNQQELLPAGTITSEKLFFMNFAKLWCTPQSNSSLSNKYRVFNSLASVPSFADAFGCKPGSKMNPVRRCKLW